MNNWLHFIGRQYYSENKFLEESREIGCSRRVALKVLKNMNFGDRVYCVLIRNREKSPVVLGYFTIDRLSGLTDEIGNVLGSRFNASISDFGGKTIKRGCGIYSTGLSYYLHDTPMFEIAEALEDYQNIEPETADVVSGFTGNIGSPLVQGEWTDLYPVIRLRRVKFRQGFRLFNVEKAIAEAAENSRHTAKGHYYVFDKPTRAIKNDNWPGSEVQTLVCYRKFEKGDVQ